MNELKLAISPLTNNVYVAKMKPQGSGYVVTGNKTDLTQDFLRCVVRYCTEEVEFVVDGMRFRATCERID